MYEQKNSESNEQEEYIALQRVQRVGLVETDTDAVMEWTWELETNIHASNRCGISSTQFGMSPVIEDRIYHRGILK